MKIIKIKDYYGEYQEVPVSDELYEEWKQLSNETQRVHRREFSHRDKTPLDEVQEDMLISSEEEPEEAVIRRSEFDALYRAIEKLPPIQQRRIRMYMNDMSVREIARQEGCYMNSALKSINAALARLRILLSE